MHDMLPWDDDIDIMIRHDTRHKVINLFKDEGQHGIRGLQRLQNNGKIIKLFFNDSTKAGENVKNEKMETYD